LICVQIPDNLKMHADNGFHLKLIACGTSYCLSPKRAEFFLAPRAYRTAMLDSPLSPVAAIIARTVSSM
jgi:hypothetical protein